jgi:hypothetical protein
MVKGPGILSFGAGTAGHIGIEKIIFREVL